MMANLENIPVLAFASKEDWAALKEQSICIEVSMTIDGEEFWRGITVKPEDYEDYKECHAHTERMIVHIGRTFANVIIHKKFKD